MSKFLVRTAAIYLWWFVVVFGISVMFGSHPLFAEGTWLGDALVRRPYQWDFELMFTVMFFVWGVFLWRSASPVETHRSLIKFSAWAFLTHGMVFVAIGLIRQDVLVHALQDSIWWLAAGVALFYAGRVPNRTNL